MIAQIKYRYNQYPANYEEEEFPQIIIEIRYKKGSQEEATNILDKLETTGRLPIDDLHQQMQL